MRNMWEKEKEGWLGGTEDPNETGDHKFVMAIIYSFESVSKKVITIIIS